MTKHTPGPWTVGEPPYHTHAFGPDGFAVIETQGSGAIHRDYYAGKMGVAHWALTPGSHIDREPEEEEANARLAAAAPDLLTQLKGLYGLAQFIISATDIDADQTRCVLRNNGEEVAEVPIAVLLTHAQAAIAKAEGVLAEPVPVTATTEA